MGDRQEVAPGCGLLLSSVDAGDGPAYVLHNVLVNRRFHATVTAEGGSPVEVVVDPKQSIDVPGIDGGVKITPDDVKYTEELVVMGDNASAEDAETLYTDTSFRGAENLPRSDAGDDIVWVRARNIPPRSAQHAELWEAPASFDAAGITVDPASTAADAWFAEALSVVAGQPLAMQRVLPQTVAGSPSGAGIDVRLNHGGLWTTVTIDDHLPFNTKTQRVHGVSNADVPEGTTGRGYYWAAFVYKAYAKLHGGYAAVDGEHAPAGASRAVKTLAALRALTGGVGGEVTNLDVVGASDDRAAALIADMRAWLREKAYVSASTRVGVMLEVAGGAGSGTKADEGAAATTVDAPADDSPAEGSGGGGGGGDGGGAGDGNEEAQETTGPAEEGDAAVEQPADTPAADDAKEVQDGGTAGEEPTGDAAGDSAAPTTGEDAGEDGAATPTANGDEKTGAEAETAAGPAAAGEEDPGTAEEEKEKAAAEEGGKEADADADADEGAAAPTDGENAAAAPGAADGEGAAPAEEAVAAGDSTPVDAPDAHEAAPSVCVPSDMTFAVVSVIPVADDAAAASDDEPFGDQYLICIESTAGTACTAAARRYAAHRAAELVTKKRDVWSTQAQDAAQQQVAEGRGFSLWLTAAMFFHDFECVAWTSAGIVEDAPGTDVRLKSTFELSDEHASTGLLVWADMGVRMHVAIQADTSAPPAAVGVFVCYPSIQGGVRFFQSRVAEGAAASTVLVGVDDVAAGQPVAVVPYSATPGCRDYALSVTAARKQTLKRCTPFHVTASQLNYMLLQAALHEPGSEVAEGLSVHKCTRGSEVVVAYRNARSDARFSVSLTFAEQDAAGGALRQLHPKAAVVADKALRIDACAQAGNEALIARVARVADGESVLPPAPADFQISYALLEEGDAVPNAAGTSEAATAAFSPEGGGGGAFDEGSVVHATKLCTMQVDGETFAAVAAEDKGAGQGGDSEKAPASPKSPEAASEATSRDGAAQGSTEGRSPGMKPGAKRGGGKKGGAKRASSTEPGGGTDDPHETATARALRMLEADAAAMRNETPPRSLAYRGLGEPTPQRSGAATAPLPSVHNPRSHTPSPSGFDNSVFDRLYATPHAKPHTAPARKSRKLTRLEQLQSVDRMFKDAIQKRETELKKLETRVYGDCSFRHVLSMEEMQAFTDKLYNQGCAARAERRRRLQDQYLTELVPPKKVDRAHQNAVVKKLYDTIEHDRGLSATLDTKYNTQRSKKVRNEADWAATVERLSTKQ